MSDSSFDCVSCGACCFSRNPRYLSLLPWDAGRSLPADSLFSEQGQTFVKFECGHCVHLDLSNGKAACGIYEDRPEACRAFRAGSFECVKARRAGPLRLASAPWATSCTLQCSASAVQWAVRLRRGWTLVGCTDG